MHPVGILQSNDRVASRLDHAAEILIARPAEPGGEIRLNRVPLAHTDAIRRVRQIVHLGVGTLVCGAVSQFVVRMFQHHGIQVIGWVIGDTRKVLDAYCRGHLREGMVFHDADATVLRSASGGARPGSSGVAPGRCPRKRRT